MRQKINARNTGNKMKIFRKVIDNFYNLVLQLFNVFVF